MKNVSRNVFPGPKNIGIDPKSEFVSHLEDEILVIFNSEAILDAILNQAKFSNAPGADSYSNLP